MLTQQMLRNSLDYDRDSGVFTRCGSNGKTEVAGSLSALGYVRISVNRRLYMAHRLAFLYMTGEWPENEVDHVNGDRSDNRWSNLRSATRAQNCQHLHRLKINNTSGYMGVYKRGPRWRAVIKSDGKTYQLGEFHTAAEAGVAYQQAKLALHTFCYEEIK